MEDKSLALTLIDELKAQNKRQHNIIVILIIVIAGIVLGGLMYLNQFDYSNDTATFDTENSGTITTGDITNG